MESEDSTGESEQFSEPLGSARSVEVIRASRGKYPESMGSTRLRDLKLGFLDKPRSHVLVKHKWPHMNQNPRYITETLSFNQLNFQQFVKGECHTIIRAKRVDEIYSRLRILSKIAYLYDQCKSWEHARSVYFAIISSIEEGEAEWASLFGYYDLMCPAPPQTKF